MSKPLNHDLSIRPVVRSGSRLLLGASLLLGMLLFYHWFGEALDLKALNEREEDLRNRLRHSPGPVLGLAFLAYVLVTGASLPGAALLTLGLGWFLGFWKALVLVSFASTTGATLAFLMSRFLFRELIQARFRERLSRVNKALATEGAFYLFTLRMIPVIPFFVINLVMGLTPISVRTFWWVSQLGMLPATGVFVYAGSQFPSLHTLLEQGAGGILKPGLVLALVLLGLFPWMVKRAMARWRQAPMETDM
ncbi:MAG: TVP38/TMEM64 family protein [Verrucomicrobiota bacterium]|nr:TVP38/TMEM64 family protein [Verrucomicrobiota bacterium]